MPHTVLIEQNLCHWIWAQCCRRVGLMKHTSRSYIRGATPVGRGMQRVPPKPQRMGVWSARANGRITSSTTENGKPRWQCLTCGKILRLIPGQYNSSMGKKVVSQRISDTITSCFLMERMRHDAT